MEKPRGGAGMRRRTGRGTWVAVAAAAFVVAGGIGMLLLGARRPAQRLPDGSTIALAGVTYGSRHQLVEEEWWQKLFAPILPPRLRPHPNRFTSVYNADHPKTLVLWTDQQKMLPTSHWNQGAWERRVVTFDEQDRRSETGLLAGSAGLNWPS